MLEVVRIIGRIIRSVEILRLWMLDSVAVVALVAMVVAVFCLIEFMIKPQYDNDIFD